MSESETRREVVHGLRHRESGRLVRVRAETVVLQDEPYYNESTSYHMTLDEDHPIFDAGSVEELAHALLSRSGGSEGCPNPGSFSPGDVEGVVIETVVTRRLERIEVDFDQVTELQGSAVYDLDRRLAKSIPDLQPFLDALADHADELASGKMPGGEWDWGAARLVALVVPKPSHELEGLSGGIVSQGQGSLRRAVGAVDLPSGMAHLVLTRRGETAGPASVLVCLQDTRPAPQDFLDQAAGRAPAPGL